MIDSGHLLETLRFMIRDFEEMELPTGVTRRLRIETVRGKATGCIGVRRSGKSTYLYQLIARLLERGVPRQNILYLNFFDDRLQHLRHGELGLITDAYFCCIDHALIASVASPRLRPGAPLRNPSSRFPLRHRRRRGWEVT